jgi:hypothetical protein
VMHPREGSTHELHPNYMQEVKGFGYENKESVLQDKNARFARTESKQLTGMVTTSNPSLDLVA